jgi:hypothetical protein
MNNLDDSWAGGGVALLGMMYDFVGQNKAHRHPSFGAGRVFPG